MPRAGSASPRPIARSSPPRTRLGSMSAPVSSIRIDETGADIDPRRVLGGEDLAIGRGDADPALGIERSGKNGDEWLDRDGHGQLLPLHPMTPRQPDPRRRL